MGVDHLIWERARPTNECVYLGYDDVDKMPPHSAQKAGGRRIGVVEGNSRFLPTTCDSVVLQFAQFMLAVVCGGLALYGPHSEECTVRIHDGIFRVAPGHYA